MTRTCTLANRSTDRLGHFIAFQTEFVEAQTVQEQDEEPKGKSNRAYVHIGCAEWFLARCTMDAARPVIDMQLRVDIASNENNILNIERENIIPLQITLMWFDLELAAGSFPSRLGVRLSRTAVDD